MTPEEKQILEDIEIAKAKGWHTQVEQLRRELKELRKKK